MYKRQVEVLEKLLKKLEKEYPEENIDYTGKTSIKFFKPGEKKASVEVFTKRREGIDVVAGGSRQRLKI